MKSFLRLRNSLLIGAAGAGMAYYANKSYNKAYLWTDNGKRVYAWGAGMQGQLGLGEERFSLDIPTEVEELSDDNVVYVDANGDLSAALTQDGDIFIWGKTKGGAVGSQFTTNLMVPTQLEFEGEKFKDFGLGNTHMAAVTKSGRVATMGNPHRGKLGHAPKMAGKKGYKPTLYADKSASDYVANLDDVEITEVACGKHHTVALSANGDVYTWGHGKEGALGHGNFEQVNEPKKIETLSNIVKIDAGGDFTIVQDKDGHLYSFGRNQYGQLGQMGDNLHK